MCIEMVVYFEICNFDLQAGGVLDEQKYQYSIDTVLITLIRYYIVFKHSCTTQCITFMLSITCF